MMKMMNNKKPPNFGGFLFVVRTGFEPVIISL
jgi:hypothetical protein